MKIRITIELWKEGDLYVTRSPELDMVAQGYSAEMAKKNLLEVIGIQFKEMKYLGTLDDFLSQAGYQLEEGEIFSEKEIIGFEKSFVELERVG
ncbi:MAG: hypothetical protein WC625_07490 [Caldisericia bacterium]